MRVSVLVVRDRPLENVDLYDGLSEELGIHTAADLDPGCRMHAVAGTAAARLVIAEVWDSREALARFTADRFEPAARSFGLTPSQPLVVPLHRHVAARSGTADVLAIVEEREMSAAEHDRSAAFALTRSAVAHAVGIADGGIVTVEAWTSAEACAEFRRRVLARARGGWEPAAPRVEPLFRLLER